MANKKDITKTDVKKIIEDEFKSFLKNQLDDEIAKILSKRSSKTRAVTNDIVKLGLSKLAEFLYIRKNIWQSDIK